MAGGIGMRQMRTVGLQEMRQSSIVTSAGAKPCNCGCDGDWCPSLSQSALEISRIGIALARGLISGEAYDPRQVALSAVRMSAACADGLSALPTPADRARWLELSNKLTAYRLFVSADSLIRATGPHLRDLPAILQKLA